MTRLLVLGLGRSLLALALATPALGDDIGAKKQARRLEDRDAAREARRAAAGARAALRGEIAGVSSRIRELEVQVGDVSLQLQTLEQDLALRQQRASTKLNQLFRLQTQRLKLLRQQYRLSVDRLNERLVAIYESERRLDARRRARLGVDPGGARPGELPDEDRRRRTARSPREVAHSKRVVAAGAHEDGEAPAEDPGRGARARRAGAPGDRGPGRARRCASLALDSTKQQKLVALSDLSAQERAEASEIDALQAGERRSWPRRSAPRRPRSAGPTATPSSAGLIWPVSGPGHEPVRLALGPHAPGDRHRRRRPARRSTRPPPGRSSTAAGRAATATSSSSTTAATSRPRTATSPRSPSPAARRSARAR